MARKDGIPTNREMQVDVTTAAHGIFVAAFERAVESDMPPAYSDKPLSLLEFKAGKTYEVNDDTSQTYQREQLLIVPISKSSAGSLVDNEMFRDAPTDVLDLYRAIATGIADVNISPSLHLRDELPPEGVEFDYTASLTNGRERHASTFRERAAKQSLTAASYLAEEIANYVHSDEFDIPRRTRAFKKAMGSTGVTGYTGIEHVFSFRFDPSLPINGHESKRFIGDFCRDMLRRLKASEKRVEQLETMDFIPEFIIQQERDRQHSYETAYNNAQRFL